MEGGGWGAKWGIKESKKNKTSKNREKKLSGTRKCYKKHLTNINGLTKTKLMQGLNYWLDKTCSSLNCLMRKAEGRVVQRIHCWDKLSTCKGKVQKITITIFGILYNIIFT